MNKSNKVTEKKGRNEIKKKSWLTRKLEEHALIIGAWAGIATIISTVFCVLTFFNGDSSAQNTGNEINVNINAESAAQEDVREKLLQAEEKYVLGKYSSASEIYNSLLDKSDVANLNLGYLYAHGYGVTQDTDKASEYYVKAYEMGNPQGLKNYIAINLQCPVSYDSTLTALKYGFDHNDETAIQYLSICQYGELQKASMEELNILAQQFLRLPYDSQIQKLQELKYNSAFDTIYVDESEVLINKEFETFTNLNKGTDYKTISEYAEFTDKNDKRVILPVHTVQRVAAYRKTIYSFYMAYYFESDLFYKI